MREFFRGWKRKLGVATLLMACMLAAGWVDSLTTCREITFYPTESIFHYWTASSHHGKFNASWVKPPRVMGPPSPFYERIDIERCTDWSGAPYWLIVIPLMLLSSYLLLSKPRTSQSKPVSES